MSAVDKHYGWTVTGTGLAKMWRGFLPFLVVSVVNAVVQASLLSLPVLWLAWGVSAAVLLVGFALMTHIADRSVTQRSGLSDLRGARLAHFATWVIGLTSLAIYCVLDVISDSVVEDSVYSVGIAIMTYYSVVAISSVVYFRHTAFRSWRTAMGQVILPAIGALILIPVGILEAYQMADPETGSGASLLGVGTAFVVGVFGLALGVVLMIVWNLKAPAFFRGQTLPRERT